MKVTKKNSYSLAIAVALLLAAACGSKTGVPATVTYTEHVAPILFSNCVICHRPGGNAHFSLATYQDAKRNAGVCAYVTKARIMPPWPADAQYTSFVGERMLTEKEIQIIGKWYEQGAQEGPKDKMPVMPQYPQGSVVGTPDVRIPVQPVLLPAHSSDQFLLVKVPYLLPQDAYVSLIEFMPGPRNVVHHVNGDVVKYEFEKKADVYAGERVVNMELDSGKIRQAYERLGLPNDDGTYPMLQKSVVNFLPGVYGQKYPEGIGGYILPRKGAFLLNDMHYGFNNKDEDIWDSSYINIFYAKTPPKRPVKEFQLGTLGVSPVEPDLVIQPNTTKTVYSRFTVPYDISILTVNPHMHLLGKTFKAYALQPNGDTIRLISIPRWDFNWQYFYTFKKMVKIPAGSTIVAEGLYDNTRQNPNNPFSPPQLVRDNNGSMKATDEMFQFIITYLPYEAGDENVSLETK